MIFFTSLSATTNYLIFGTLKLNYGGYLFAIAFISTFIGQWASSYIIKIMGRTSPISFIIFFVVSASTLLMALSMIEDITSPSTVPQDDAISATLGNTGSILCSGS